MATNMPAGLNGEEGLALAVIYRATLDLRSGDAEIAGDARDFFEGPWFVDLCDFLDILPDSGERWLAFVNRSHAGKEKNVFKSLKLRKLDEEYAAEEAEAREEDAQAIRRRLEAENERQQAEIDAFRPEYARAVEELAARLRAAHKANERLRELRNRAPGMLTLIAEWPGPWRELSTPAYPGNTSRLDAWLERARHHGFKV